MSRDDWVGGAASIADMRAAAFVSETCVLCPDSALPHTHLPNTPRDKLWTCQLNCQMGKTDRTEAVA